MVFAWNPQSIWRALYADQSDPPVNGKGNHLVVHLDRFSEADQALTLARQGKQEATLPGYPYGKIQLEAHARSEGYRINVQLVGSGQ